AQKVRIRNLLMAGDARCELGSHGNPAFRVSDRPVVVAGMRPERLKDSDGSLQSDRTQFHHRICRYADEPCLGEWANAPVVLTCREKPALCLPTMNVFRI